MGARALAAPLTPPDFLPRLPPLPLTDRQLAPVLHGDLRRLRPDVPQGREHDAHRGAAHRGPPRAPRARDRGGDRRDVAEPRAGGALPRGGEGVAKEGEEGLRWGVGKIGSFDVGRFRLEMAFC